MRDAAGGARLFVGTYAGKGGQGLYPLERLPSGELRVGEPAGGPQNASFGVWSPRHRLHYLVDEREDGAIGAWRWSGDGGWEQLAHAPTGGALPCFVSLDPAETCLAVANYGSGSCAAIPLDPATGLFAADRFVRRNGGTGPDPERQEGPHAHCAVFGPDGCWLFQTDLGTDEVRAFAWDGERGMPGEGRTAFRAPPGSGPRHLLFAPGGRTAYLLSELAATVTVLRVDGPTLEPVQTVPTCPEPGQADNLGGHVAWDDARGELLVTNRGHESLAAFAAERDGTLRLADWSPTGGASPRFFLQDGPDLILAHEESGTVRVIRRDGRGKLALAPHEAAVPGAAFIVRVP